MINPISVSKEKLVWIVSFLLGIALVCGIGWYDTYKDLEKRKLNDGFILQHFQQMDNANPIIVKDLVTGDICVKKSKYDTKMFCHPKVCSPEGVL